MRAGAGHRPRVANAPSVRWATTESADLCRAPEAIQGERTVEYAFYLLLWYLATPAPVLSQSLCNGLA